MSDKRGPWSIVSTRQAYDNRWIRVSHHEVITPSGDMWNQSAMALPMIGLYLISILLAWIFGKKKKKELLEEEP